jgi:heterodisulfide reductase subunit C
MSLNAFASIDIKNKIPFDTMKETLRNAGVVGAGGAGFPSYAKLSDKAEIVILNCAECEPLLKLHRQVLEEYTYEILSALSKVLETTGASKGIIAIKSHYTSALKALEEEISDFPNISISTLPSIYPAGDEIILIKEVTGRTVSPGKLPISEGVIVYNVESMYNVYNAIKGHPVTHKYVTIAGDVKKPITILAPIGTKISELITAAGGITTEDVEYLSGGPMMGKLINPNDVVTKTTNAVIVLPSEHNVVMGKKRNFKINLRRAMSVCCQCRSCTDLCSRHVIGYPVEPHTVMRVFSNGGAGATSSLSGAMFCSGCGLCETYSCPQGLSPRAIIAEMKDAARKNGIKPPQGIEPDLNVKDASLRKVSVERLTSRLGLKKYPYTCDYHYFDEVDTEEKAYWLGFLTADGWINKNGNNNAGVTGIELQYGDINHLKKFNKSIGGNYKITDRWRSCAISTNDKDIEHHMCCIRIFSLTMYNSLIDKGFTKDKSFDCNMPSLREDLIKHYIRGYFDGDGCLCFTNKSFHINFTTASKTLNDDVSKVLRLENFNIAEHTYINDYGTTMYKIDICCQHDKINFLDWIYKDSSIYLDRKYKKYLKVKKHYGTA